MNDLDPHAAHDLFACGGEEDVLDGRTAALVGDVVATFFLDMDDLVLLDRERHACDGLQLGAVDVGVDELGGGYLDLGDRLAVL